MSRGLWVAVGLRLLAGCAAGPIVPDELPPVTVTDEACDPTVDIMSTTVREHGDGLVVADMLGQAQRIQDGEPDATFGEDSKFAPSFDDERYHEWGYADVAVDSQQRVLSARSVRLVGDTHNTWTVRRGTPAGVLDPVFGVGGRALVTWPTRGRDDRGGPQRLVNHDGLIYVVGEPWVDHERFLGLFRLDEAGQLDTTFASEPGQPGVLVRVGGLRFPVQFALETANGLLVGGGPWTVERFSWDGVEHTSWPDTDLQRGEGTVLAGAVDATHLYVVGIVPLPRAAGLFALQVQRRMVDSLDPDPTYGEDSKSILDMRKHALPVGDLTFSGSPTDVRGVALAEDGSLFLNVVLRDSAIARRALVKLDPTGALDIAWNGTGGLVLPGFAYERPPALFEDPVSVLEGTTDNLALLDGALVVADSYVKVGALGDQDICSALESYAP